MPWHLICSILMICPLGSASLQSMPKSNAPLFGEKNLKLFFNFLPATILNYKFFVGEAKIPDNFKHLKIFNIQLVLWWGGGTLVSHAAHALCLNVCNLLLASPLKRPCHTCMVCPLPFGCLDFFQIFPILEILLPLKIIWPLKHFFPQGKFLFHRCLLLPIFSAPRDSKNLLIINLTMEFLNLIIIFQ